MDKLFEAYYKAPLEGCTGGVSELDPERTDCGFGVNVLENVVPEVS